MDLKPGAPAGKMMTPHLGAADFHPRKRSPGGFALIARGPAHCSTLLCMVRYLCDILRRSIRSGFPQLIPIRQRELDKHYY
ncbi:hypothetical protein INR49_016282 [Caranx melampygus]|nr:hypothetical protein INR49_016282 [Caranx melampygus]